MSLKEFLEQETLRNLEGVKVSFLIEDKRLSSDGVVTMRDEEVLGSGYIRLDANAEELTIDSLKAIFKSNALLSSLSFLYEGYMYVLESAEAICATSDYCEFVIPLKYKTPYNIKSYLSPVTRNYGASDLECFLSKKNGKFVKMESGVVPRGIKVTGEALKLTPSILNTYIGMFYEETHTRMDYANIIVNLDGEKYQLAARDVSLYFKGGLENIEEQCIEIKLDTK